MTERDHNWEDKLYQRRQDQARHDRRMQLMRMQGEVVHQERRADRWMIAAVALAVIALVLMVIL